MYALAGKLQQRAASQADRVAGQRSPREERLPPATPVHARRRTLQPHRVAIADPERGEERRERVADERRVEVLQVSRPDDDRGRQRGGDERGPRAGSDTLERLTRGHRQGLRPRDVARPEDALVGRAQQQRGRGQQQESWPDDAEPIVEDAEQERREEPAQTAEGADEAGHRAGVFWEVLRHQLEDGAVPQSHQHRAPERADRERHHRRPRQEQREQRHSSEDPRQDLRAANPIRQPPAERAHERGEHDEPCRAQSGVGGRQAELRAQQRRQVDRERDEAAECQEIEGAEQPGGGRAPQDRGHRGDRGGTPGVRGIPRQQEVGDRPGQENRAGAAKYHLPAQAGRDHGAGEDRQRLPHRPQPVDAEGRALASRRGPAGHERGADREGRSGHADEERRDEERAVTAGHRHDERGERREREERREDEASAESIGQHAHRQPRQRAEQHRHRHQERGLGCGQSVEAGEDRGEPADETPRRERERERDRREDQRARRRGGSSGHVAGRWHAVEGPVAHLVSSLNPSLVKL